MPYTQREVMTMMNRRLSRAINRVSAELQTTRQNQDVTGKAYAFPSFTVANLPTSTNLVGFTVAFATDGRKSGETAGNGTGTPVWFNTNTNEWLTFYDNSVVAA